MRPSLGTRSVAEIKVRVHGLGAVQRADLLIKRIAYSPPVLSVPHPAVWDSWKLCISRPPQLADAGELHPKNPDPLNLEEDE